MNPNCKYSYIQFSWNECLEKDNDFDRLINWLSSEFILYQQEKVNEGIKIYFPNGWFIIRFIKEKGNEYEVFISSKSKFTFTKTKKQLLSVIQRFKQFKISYSYE